MRTEMAKPPADAQMPLSKGLSLCKSETLFGIPICGQNQESPRDHHVLTGWGTACLCLCPLSSRGPGHQCVVLTHGK